MTLNQILDIYLRLCYNDGTNDPEALYITLDSKPTVESELAGLDSSAKEGKGLSHLRLWDDYGDAGLVAEETKNIQNDVESSRVSHENEFHQDQPISQPGEEKEQEQVLHDSHHACDTKDAEDSVDHESVPDSHEVEPEHVVNLQSEEDDVDQVEGEYQENAPSQGDDAQNEERDVSEASKTESSTTVVPVSEPTETKEPSVEAADLREGAAEQYGVNQQDDEPNDDNDVTHEEHFEQNGNDGKEESELYEEYVDGEIGETEDDAHPADNAPTHHEERPEDINVVPGDDDVSTKAVPQDVDDASHGQSALSSDNTAQADSTYQAHTLEPEDDLLGIAEDLMQTPAQDSQNDQAGYTEGVEFEPHPEDHVTADDQLSGETGDGGFDPDFDVSEGVDLGGTDSSLTDSHTHENCTKRSREEEDDWEIPEAAIPDNKRRRPS